MRYFFAALVFLLPTPSEAFEAVCHDYTRIYTEPASSSQSWIIREGDPFLVGLEVEATAGGGVFNRARDVYGRLGYINPVDLQGCNHSVATGTYYPQLGINDTLRYIQNEANVARRSPDDLFSIRVKDGRLVHVISKTNDYNSDFYIDFRYIDEISTGFEEKTYAFIHFDCSRACVVHPDNTRSDRELLTISAFSANEVKKLSLAFKHLSSFFQGTRSKDPFEIK
ncbi:MULTISPECIES: hypothetical protein [unclassified Mesorhizobium]|uniref:hypothetical protein n=1 Tax=unclassified Mesorhizobium TaxID=325217 RepID=UPI0024161F75|nr:MULTISPECIES: hypothetical protein [unclassified Mesorhizobium]MDG4902788.1 hypothetical protein [Mesorhizobium sp. WSM4962]MDG4920797.1 hypothetical protein [Mesorhizobium sp. WSM4989]